MKKYRLTFLYLFCWLSLPFVLAFLKWAFQFTAFPPGNQLRTASYYKVWVDNLELGVAMVLIGASSFYLVRRLIFPALNHPVSKIGKLVGYVLILLAAPCLLLALMSIFSIAVAFSFRYFLFFAYLVQIPFVLAALAAGYVQNWYYSQNALALMEKQAAKTQLELLKSQINPHFLFNTINNIDTLIIKDPPLASQYLNELASLLRFMLYEVKDEKISLSKEIAYIKKYVGLQKIRSVNPNFIKFSVKGAVGNRQIAPLLFIPLLENAAKHVTDKLSDNSIKVDFGITRGWVLFTCTNRFKETGPANENGLGLAIIAQRLALIYPGKHQLNVNKSDGRYEVSLKLFLDAD